MNRHRERKVKHKMLITSNERVGHLENISVEVMEKVEILLILMSFIFSMLLILVIISIIM